MRTRGTGIMLFVAGIFAGSALAQPAQAPAPVTRTVVAATKLQSVVETPLYFRALRLSLPPRETSTLSAANGILYQLSGSTEISIGDEMKTLRAGDGMFLAAGKAASLKAGSDQASTLLHFLLTPAPDRNKPVVTIPLSTQELYRTAEPIPDLKPGSHDLNLTRVTFPAGMPSNPPHHRSGAALYYILSGTGTNTIQGKAEAKGPGTLVYEPFGLVHQWGNAGDAPFSFLAFNINPEGVAAVVPGEPQKSK
jgi:quercetin dioxygenase-like cupin family protein